MPAAYVEACETARQKPEPYNVEYLHYDFLKAYSKVLSYSSIRPGSKPGDPTVNDIRCLRYNPTGIIEFKLNFTDPWSMLPKIMSKKRETDSVPQLNTNPLKIKNEKFIHLQQLKKVIPRDFHAFYDSLPHECLQNPCKHIPV